MVEDIINALRTVLGWIGMVITGLAEHIGISETAIIWSSIIVLASLIGSLAIYIIKVAR